MTQKIIESYNVEESWLFDKPYSFIKGYATAFNLRETLKALPKAREFHNGQYRKGEVIINDKSYQLPYVTHVLKVCSTLIDLNLYIPPSVDKNVKSILTLEEMDTLLASALLHDSLEDNPDRFPKGGIELVTEHHFSYEVYDIVKLLSKRSGATEEELMEYFNTIKQNKLALLIKLADRSHNVEDLYIMKTAKLHKYVNETRTYIYPLVTYGKAHYPELSNGLTSLKSKIRSLTECTETIMIMYESDLAKKNEEIVMLNDKIAKLEKELEKAKKAKK